MPFVLPPVAWSLFMRGVPRMSDLAYVNSRVNGLNPFASGLIAIPPSLTVYALVTLPDGSPSYWSADGGVTPAPDYVAGIGVIA